MVYALGEDLIWQRLVNQIAWLGVSEIR
jgi:hypothetical protein